MDDLYTRVTLHSVVNITPQELNKRLNKTIVNKIKNEMEGKCMKDGFIRPNSVMITSRSLGKSVQSQFNGALSFSVEYVADLCNPVEGDIFQCRVEVINKMGIILVSSDEDPSPVNVLLAKQHHMNNDEFQMIKPNDIVYIKVIGKRFDSGESQISIIGLLSSKKEYNELMQSKAEVPEPITTFEVETPKEPEPEPEVKESEPEPEVKEPEPEPEPEVKEPEPEPEPEIEEPEPEVKEPVVEGEPIHYFTRSKDTKWLSVFHKAKPFTYDGRSYATVEHAFHAQKAMCDDKNKENVEKLKDFLTIGKPNYIGDDPKEAKKYGSKKAFKEHGVTLCKDWNTKRLQVMKDITRAYYNANPEMKQKLINTGNRPLLHKGFRIDSYWGMSGKKDETPVGENKHGKILMELRREFQQ